jgi:thymidylate synthase (FAD)
MEIVKQSIERLYPETQEQADEGLRLLERAGRTCYKSEAKITDDSAPKFAKMILVRQHDSVVEHLTASYKIICDRALSHEIVRHLSCKTALAVASPPD